MTIINKWRNQKVSGKKKIQVRMGVFETNSSSTHSIVICTEEEYEKWKDGKLVYLYDIWSIPEDLRDSFKDRKFISIIEKEVLEENGVDEYDIKSFDEWGKDYEQETTKYTSPSGDKLVIRSYFGYNG